MEQRDHMKEALQARRGKGLDIIIGLGPHSDGKISGTDQGEHEDHDAVSAMSSPKMREGGKVSGTDTGEHEDMDAKSGSYGKLGKVAETGDKGPDGRDGISGTRDGESNYDFKRSDLAPPPESKSSLDAFSRSGSEMHPPHPKGVMGGQQEYAPGDVPTNDDMKAHMMSDMSENDLRDMSNRKPRSLVERARKMAFEQKKQ